MHSLSGYIFYLYSESKSCCFQAFLGTGIEWGFVGVTVSVLGAVAGSSWFAASQFASARASTQKLELEMGTLKNETNQKLEAMNTKLEATNTKLETTNTKLEEIKMLLLNHDLALVQRMAYVEGCTQAPRFKPERDLAVADN